MPDGTRLFGRRDDGDVAQRSKRIGERHDSLRAVPIVVGDKNLRHAGLELYQRLTTPNSSAVAVSASAAPAPNAVAAPNVFQSRPKKTLASSAPMPSTALYTPKAKPRVCAGA